MPTKVSIGLSKKRGLPDYGSLGASCHVELELDGQILEGDPVRFRQHVERAYAACRSAVEDELARGDAASHPRTNGHSSNGRNGHSTNGRNGKRPATASQIKAIYAIAKRNTADLVPHLSRLGVRSAEDLDIGQASELIGELKAQQNAVGSRR